MKTTVVYGSRYGTAEKYARRLAQLLECEVVSANAFAGAYSDERVIFVGSLYAQRVTALKKTIKRIAPGASVCVVTVGLADPAIPKNVERITSSVKKQLPDSFRSAKVYCLRGGIDFSKLGFIPQGYDDRHISSDEVQGLSERGGQDVRRCLRKKDRLF